MEPTLAYTVILGHYNTINILHDYELERELCLYASIKLNVLPNCNLNHIYTEKGSSDFSGLYCNIKIMH